DGIRDRTVTGVQTCALPISIAAGFGTGAELRQPLGLAVVGGLLVSQVITLFITPVIYVYLDRYSGKGPVTKRVAVPEAHAPAAEIGRASGRERVEILVGGVA